jgi:hypothetical protein
MFKYFAVTALFLLTSTKVLAAFIYADDFAVGEDVSQLTSNATLSWLEGTGNSSPSLIFSPVGFYHQHFGGTNSATTYDTFPGLWEEAHGSPNPHVYAALEINFDSAIRSFGFKAENHTSSPFGVYLYDTDGNFLELLTAYVVNTGIPNPDSYGSIFDATYHWSFDFDVGKIRIGGASDAGYIYALDVSQVPEPTTIALLFMGLLVLTIVRRSADTRQSL